MILMYYQGREIKPHQKYYKIIRAFIIFNRLHISQQSITYIHGT